MKKKKIEWEECIGPLEEERREEDSNFVPDDSEEFVEEYSQMSEMTVVHVGPDGRGVEQGGAFNNILDLYNVWVAHTNFDLTEQNIVLASEVDGVENIRLITRYRLMIAFGKLFDSSEVKKDIQNLFYDDVQSVPTAQNKEIPTEIQEKIDALKEDLSKYSGWAIFVFPNGKINHCHSENEDFEEKLLGYLQLEQDIKGLLVMSNE